MRKDYENILREIEGGDESENPAALVHWPRKGVLCYPRFSSSPDEGDKDDEEIIRSTPPQSEETEREEEEEETMVSISPLSCPTSEPDEEEEGGGTEGGGGEIEGRGRGVGGGGRRGGEGQQVIHETVDTLQPTTQEEDTVEEKEKRSELNLTSQLFQEMMDCPPLVVTEERASSLPRHNPASLEELKWHTEMELLWLKQAISSRQNYLQLKNQMKNKERN